MNATENSIGYAVQELSMTKHSLAQEADRCLAKMSVEDGDCKIVFAHGAVERCITDKNRYRSRSPKDDKKPVYNKNLSLADELSQLPDEDTAPIDWTVNPSDNTSGTAYEGEEALENVDLDGFEIHEESTPADSARAGAAYTAYKPKKPSKLAFQLGQLGQENDNSDPIPGRHASEPRNQDSGSAPSDARSNSNEGNIEERRPRRSRMDIWLEGIQDAENPSSEGIHEELESGISEPMTALTVISVVDEDLRSSREPVDEDRDSSLTYVQGGSRETSHSTRVATNEDDSEPKLCLDHDWSSHVDFDEDVDLQPPSPWTHVHDDNDIANGKSLPPLPQTPSSMKSAALEGKELDEFIKVSIFAVNAIRFNKDKHTVSKTRDIQQLVEKVLVDGVCGRRKSFGDMLDRSSWRP